MNGRLASFQGPSTPNAKPALVNQHNSPSSPSRRIETTYHRKVRSTLQELRSATRTWDELVQIDGLKAAQSLIDTRTDLDNALRLFTSDCQPRTHVVGLRLSIMNKRINELDDMILKLRKNFQKMCALVETLEETLYEAFKTKGWVWVHNEPLWCTWPLEKFVSTIPNLLSPYHRSLAMHEEHVNTLRDHSTTFEASRSLLAQWVEQPHLGSDAWTSDWEDLCSVEVENWEAR